MLRTFAEFRTEESAIAFYNRMIAKGTKVYTPFQSAWSYKWIVTLAYKN